jgi:hypothetical protein
MIRAATTALALLAIAASCRTSGAERAGRDPLDVAATALDLGEAGALESQLEPLFADAARPLDPEPRFWSAWMLAQARALRALEVPPGGGGAGIQRTSLELGALYFARQASDVRSSADGAAPVPGGGEVTVADAARGLDLLRVALLARLGFDERVAWVLDQLPGTGTLVDLAERVDRSGLHERLRPGVWLALFGDRARRDPTQAFPFAAAALASSDLSPGSAAAADVLAVEAWIEHEAPFVYCCPECAQPAIPQLRACPNDQTRLDRFVPSPRS